MKKTFGTPNTTSFLYRKSQRKRLPPHDASGIFPQNRLMQPLFGVGNPVIVAVSLHTGACACRYHLAGFQRVGLDYLKLWGIMYSFDFMAPESRFPFTPRNISRAHSSNYRSN